MTLSEINDRLDRINTLFKMFGIDASVVYFPERPKPFYLNGRINGASQGISRSTIDEVEGLAHSFLSERPEFTLGDLLKSRTDEP